MKNICVKIFVVLSFIAMVMVNFLANRLPINGRSTGVISDSYPNLFAPAGVTFSIWGLIYLLLALYTLYQFILSRKNKSKENFLRNINTLFIYTSLANISWIFAWHYDFIGLSVLIMATLLILLIKITRIIYKEQLTSGEKFLISTPFSIYFGWITVAAIANTTVFLVSINWNGFGITDFIWTSIILLAGALIGILMIKKDKNIAYALVLIWAYFGILFKHVSVNGFNQEYQSIIITLIVCLALFIFFTGKLLIKK
ncbi:MAG: hypothetical protein QG630_97 [Patescibacteria group bacterium]|nr:hypothetical protein [Patescibacteria group bacterium]